MADPLARSASVYHVPRLKPEMVDEPSSVKLSTRHRLTVPSLAISLGGGRTPGVRALRRDAARVAAQSRAATHRDGVHGLRQGALA